MQNPLSATLIYDGSSSPVLPFRLLPAPGMNADHDWTDDERYAAALQLVAASGQLKGTALELLSETAGRACYDSFGKGRPSEAYHSHLVEVNHGSVWEHPHFTMQFLFPISEQVEVLLALLNRPGVFVTDFGAGSIEIHVNFRAAREWAAFTSPFAQGLVVSHLQLAVINMARSLAPQIMQGVVPPDISIDNCYRATQVLDPIHPEARWVTLLLTGSRGFSHELVRHKYRTAVSQRSTRYVDEDGSAYVVHPVVAKYLLQDLKEAVVAKNESQEAYRILVAVLQEKLIEAGVDKFTARKQARGAARGYLGNALYTEVVFSASVAQWKRMLLQRANPAADAEIREVFCKALVELKLSRYRYDFIGWDLIDSPDGIGQVVKVAA